MRRSLAWRSPRSPPTSLLPHPGGVEGLGLAPEAAPPDHLPIAPFRDQPHRPLNRRAAPRALRAKAPAHERPVPEVSYLIDLCLEIAENLESLLPPALDTGVATVRLASLDRNL